MSARRVVQPGNAAARAFDLLSAAEVGAVLTYEALEAALGVPVRPLMSSGRYALFEAAARLGRDCGRGITGVRGVGYRVTGREERR